MRTLRIAILAGLLFVLGQTHAVQAQEVVTFVVFAEQNGELSHTADALHATGLTGDLQDGEYTFFAPSNDAWEDLSADLRDRLFDPENRDALREVLEYQIVEGDYSTSDLTAIADSRATEATLKNVYGSQLHVTGAQEGFLVQESAIIQPDVETVEGTVHVVDKVLLPPSMDSAAQAK